MVPWLGDFQKEAEGFGQPGGILAAAGEYEEGGAGVVPLFTPSVGLDFQQGPDRLFSLTGADFDCGGIGGSAGRFDPGWIKVGHADFLGPDGGTVLGEGKVLDDGEGVFLRVEAGFDAEIVFAGGGFENLLDPGPGGFAGGGGGGGCNQTESEAGENQCADHPCRIAGTGRLQMAKA